MPRSQALILALDAGSRRYTAAGDPAAEARVAQDLSRAATGIASELGDALSGLWLTGPFARGEGGFVAQHGEPTAYPGYDLLAVFRRKPERHAAAIRALAGAWSRLLSTRVTIASLQTRELAYPPHTRFWLEVEQGARVVLAGDPMVAQTVPAPDVAAIDVLEPTRIVARAFTTLALSELQAAALATRIEHLHAAAIAIADAWLLRAQRLPLHQRERARELERTRAARELAPGYAEALRFAQRPDRWEPGDGSAPEEWAIVARRRLAQVYLEVESARLGTPHHVFGYVRHSEPLARPEHDASAPPGLLARSRSVALRLPELSAWVAEPAERLLRVATALALAPEAPACRAHAARLLRLPHQLGEASPDQLARGLRTLASQVLDDPFGAPFERIGL